MVEFHSRLRDRRSNPKRRWPTAIHEFAVDSGGGRRAREARVRELGGASGRHGGGGAEQAAGGCDIEGDQDDGVQLREAHLADCAGH